MSDPERLDLGTTATLRRPWLLVVVLGVVLVLVLAVVLWPRQGETAPDPSTPTPTPTPTRPTPSTRPSAPPSPTPSAAAWRWTKLKPYGDAPDGMRLLLTSHEGLVTVDLAAGRLGVFPTTDRTLDNYGGDGVVVPMRNGVLFQRYGQPAYVLGNPPALRTVGPKPDPSRGPSTRWFPGPSRTWPLWRVDTDQPGRIAVQAMDLAGHTRTIALPEGVGAWAVSSDHSGGLLAEGMDGTTFAIGLAGVTRVADAPVVAAGPTRLLTVRCDAHGSCGYEVIDRTGQTAPRKIGGYVAEGVSGTISPDGATAVLTTSVGDETSLTFLDLASGAHRIGGQVHGMIQALVWSPDSRLVVATMWVNGPQSVTETPVLVVNALRSTTTRVTLPGVTDLGGIAVDPYDRPGWR